MTSASSIPATPLDRLGTLRGSAAPAIDAKDQAKIKDRKSVV